jgi:hypothetical protein
MRFANLSVISLAGIPAGTIRRSPKQRAARQGDHAQGRANDPKPAAPCHPDLKSRRGARRAPERVVIAKRSGVVNPAAGAGQRLKNDGSLHLFSGCERRRKM